MVRKKQSIRTSSGPIRLLTKDQSNVLKLIGIVSMMIDHVGILFFSDLFEFRVLGRFAFPIFAFGITQGFFFTSNLKKYFFRILLFGIISQVPFVLAFGYHELNILFTLCFGLALIYFFDKKSYFLAFLILGISVFLPMDYGVYGVLLVFSFYFLKSKTSLLSAQLILVIFFIVTSGALVQIVSLFATMIILYFPIIKNKIILPKILFYWFYPAHLIFLVVVKFFLHKFFGI